MSHERNPLRHPKTLTVVVLMLSLACLSGIAWAASWKCGTWKGHGSAGNVCISFKVKGSKITTLTVKGAPDCAYTYKCTGANDRSAPLTIAKNIRIRKDGRFAFSRKLVTQPPRGAAPGAGARRMGSSVKGRLSGSKATGTFRAYFSQDGAGGCDSGTLKWKANFRG